MDEENVKKKPFVALAAGGTTLLTIVAFLLQTFGPGLIQYFFPSNSEETPLVTVDQPQGGVNAPQTGSTITQGQGDIYAPQTGSTITQGQGDIYAPQTGSTITQGQGGIYAPQTGPQIVPNIPPISPAPQPPPSTPPQVQPQPPVPQPPPSTPPQVQPQPPAPQPPPSTPPQVQPQQREIIFSNNNGVKAVCVNLPDSIDSIQFHAWNSDGSGTNIPMFSTSDSSCMYRVNLPRNSEGGTLRVNNDWVNSVGIYAIRAGSGCSEVVRIEKGIIAASTSSNSSLLGSRDPINGDPIKWGWACK